MVDEPSIDQAFIKKLTKAVEQHLGNKDFGVGELADEIGMSRSQMHRRLKKLTGKSASQFIKEIRLKHAMDMLRKNVATASEIAYRVGFGSPTYFSKCFSDYYGFPPGEAAGKSTDEIEQLLAKTASQETDTPFLNYKRIFSVALFITIVLIVSGYFYSQNSAEKGNRVKDSIAVLPLDNLTGDPEQSYFVEGLQDALIGELGQLGELRVISRTSTLQYEDPRSNLAEIANQLNVNKIIEGSVYSVGDSLRIQLQLIGIESGEHHLWAEAYSADMRNVLNILNDVTREIAREVQISLTPQEKERLDNRVSVNRETYKAYLRGMHYINKPNPEQVRRGLNYLHEAVEKNPAEPMAYAGLAQGYINLGHGPTPSFDSFQKAKAAALTAINLDSTNAEAYSALGSYKLYAEHDWKGAEKAFRQANALNQNLPWNHYHYAWYLHLAGEKEEAIAEHKLARELDPLNPYINGWLAWLYADYGEYALAEKEVEHTRQIDADHPVGLLAKSRIYIGQQKYKDAVSVLKKAASVDPANRWALGHAFVLAGKTDQARKLLAELESEEENSYNALQIAAIYASLGKNDEAFRWLSYEPPHARLPWAARVNPFDSLRTDPRYNNFLTRFNLLQLKAFEPAYSLN